MQMLSKRQIDYASVATKLSALLGRKWGVSIIFGANPATDGTRIYLPHWNMDCPKQRTALYGAIAHEAGGHIRQTDFALLNQHCAARRLDVDFVIWKSLENILEDIRIEANLIREYPGVRAYLDAAIDLVVVANAVTADTVESYWELALGWCLYQFRYTMLGQQELRAIAEEWDAKLRQVAGDEPLNAAMLIGSKVAALGPTKAEFVSVLNYANMLKALLEQAQPKDTPDSQGAQGDQKDTQGGQDGQNGSQGAQGDQKDAQGGQDGQNGSQGAQGDQKDAQGGQDGQNGSQGAQGDQKDTQGGQDGQNGSQGVNGASRPAAVRKLSNEIPQHEIGDVFGQLTKICKSNDPTFKQMGLLGANSRGPSVVQAAEMVKGHLVKATGMRERLTAAFAPMLCGDMEYSANLRSGRNLNARRLVRAMTEEQPSVFRKVMLEEDQSVAVQVLVDRSASTKQGDVLSTETVAALGLVAALEQFPEVETAISYFPTDGGVEDMRQTQAPLIKEFGAPVGKTMARWPLPGGGTPLHDAYLGAVFNFFGSTKDRKILVVLTDGKPADVAKAESAKAFVSRIGIEVLGIVVSNQGYPPGMFDDSIQIADVQQLPSALGQLVRRNL